MTKQQQNEQLQCCSDMSNVTQNLLGYFPEVSANKRKDIRPQEFLHVFHRCSTLCLPDKTAPREQWHTYNKGLIRQKSGLRALLNSWSLCTHLDSSWWCHCCLGKWLRKVLFVFQDSETDLSYGRNGQIHVWFVLKK